MKIERVNHAIFWVSTVCFVLFEVGYLAPAWFVKEVPLRVLDTGSFSADGRMFQLPRMADDDHHPQGGEPGDGRSQVTDRPVGRTTTSSWPKRPTPGPKTVPPAQNSTTWGRPWTQLPPAKNTSSSVTMFTMRPRPRTTGAGSETTTSSSGGRRPHPGWTKPPSHDDYGSTGPSTMGSTGNWWDKTKRPTRPPYIKPTKSPTKPPTESPTTPSQTEPSTSPPSTATMPPRRPTGQAGTKHPGPRGPPPRSKRDASSFLSSSGDIPEKTGDNDVNEKEKVKEETKPEQPGDHRRDPDDDGGDAEVESDGEATGETVSNDNPIKLEPDEDSSKGEVLPTRSPDDSNEEPGRAKPPAFWKGTPGSSVEKTAQAGGGVLGKDERLKGAVGEMMTGDDVPMLYLSAGLWYGRACVNSGADSSPRWMEPGAEWCTLYIRTKASTLDRDDVMFELRLEASVALGLSLIGVLVSATSCCFRSRPGLRMALAVTCLFLSGAVMAVPVVHTICEHFSRHELLTRDRDWHKMFINTHARHDLFDHWAVIVCGAASLVSIFSTFVFACIACKSPMKPGNRYELGVSELGEHPEKRNPQLSWMGSGKVTLPPGDAFVAQQVPDPQKQDQPEDTNNSKVTPEGSSSASARDGGDSVDSFEAVQEMTSLSFKHEDVVELSDSGYSVLDDVDETSETSIQ